MSAAQGSTVLITGGTDGLGRAAAIYLAGRGYRVFTGGRNAEKRAQLDALARERRLNITSLEMDVCDDASVDRAVARVESEASIDVLINNAGLGYWAVMEEVKLADLRAQFETNFFGVVRVTQRVLPAMRERRRGRIIMMSSVAGKFAFPTFGPYSSSKYALEAISDALRLEVRQFGIRVSLIEPGYIPTSFQGTAAAMSAEYVQHTENSPYRKVYEGYLAQRKRMTQGQSYTPEDCARVIAQAIEQTPPRARYPVTRSAWVITLAKRFLPDALLDRQVLRSLGLDG